jgi:hypothetical protein
LQNRDTWKTMCDRNREYAKEKFEISSVVKRLEHIYFEIAQ